MDYLGGSYLIIRALIRAREGRNVRVRDAMMEAEVRER